MSKQIGIGEGWVSAGRLLTPDEQKELVARGYQITVGSQGHHCTRRPGDGVFEPREQGPDPLFKKGASR